MSAGTEEDDFSRMSREAREKRRKKALALDIGDDVRQKTYRGYSQLQEYDAETYNTQTNSPRRNYKPGQWNLTFINNLVKHKLWKGKVFYERVSFKDDNKIQVTTNSIDDDSDSALPLDTI